MKNPKYTFCA